MPEHRGNVDDAPAFAGRDHVAPRAPRAKKLAGQIDRDDSIPVLQGEFAGRPYDVDAGIVHQNVDRAERCPNLVECPLHGVFVGNVGGDAQLTAARMPPLGIDCEVKNRNARSGP